MVAHLLARARQNDPDFCELPGLRLDIDCATVLFHDDVVAYRETEASAFTRRLGREERTNIFSFTSGGDSDAVVANADLYRIAEIFCGRAEGRFKTLPTLLCA